MPSCDISSELRDKLSGLKLVRELLGHCTITPRGQLEIHRQRFRKASSSGVVRVNGESRLFLHETGLDSDELSLSEVRDILNSRIARLEPTPVDSTEDEAEPTQPSPDPEAGTGPETRDTNETAATAGTRTSAEDEQPGPAGEVADALAVELAKSEAKERPMRSGLRWSRAVRPSQRDG